MRRSACHASRRRPTAAARGPAVTAAAACGPSTASGWSPLGLDRLRRSAGASDGLVARDAHGLATLGVDGVSLARNGALDVRAGRRPDPAARHRARQRAARRAAAQQLQQRARRLRPEGAAKLLRDPDRVQAVAAQLASYVARQGWDGIQVDLESMSARGRRRAARCSCSELQTTMAPEKSVSIAVMASTDAAGVRRPRLPAGRARPGGRHAGADDLRPARPHLPRGQRWAPQRRAAQSRAT